MSSSQLYWKVHGAQCNFSITLISHYYRHQTRTPSATPGSKLSGFLSTKKQNTRKGNAPFLRMIHSQPQIWHEVHGGSTWLFHSRLCCLYGHDCLLCHWRYRWDLSGYVAWCHLLRMHFKDTWLVCWRLMVSSHLRICCVRVKLYRSKNLLWLEESIFDWWRTRRPGIGFSIIWWNGTTLEGIRAINAGRNWWDALPGELF